jgi:hypothetical protein
MRRGEDGGFAPSQTREDLEEMMKESRVITAEEEAKMKEGGSWSSRVSSRVRVSFSTRSLPMLAFKELTPSSHRFGSSV